MKKIFFTLAFLSSASHADEGMWMPQQLPRIAPQLKAAGLKLDATALSKLTEFPMDAIVNLGDCSGSFVSGQGLIVTNHHCVYDSVANNSTPARDLLADGFLALAPADELPATSGTRVLVTQEVRDVTAQILTPAVARLAGKERVDGMEKNQKALVAACEKDAGHRCSVGAFYGGLEYQLIKQLEIRDVRLVYAPPVGVGKFGGDTDNWMWPRHTGDFGFYRAYVSRDGKAADYAKDNVPYLPTSHLKMATDGVKAGDFIMALGYPGDTERHRLPAEVGFTFGGSYPAYVKRQSERLAIIDRLTKNDADAKLKYAGQVAGANNYLKNRQGMLASYEGSGMLARKASEFDALKAWVAASPGRKAKFAAAIEQVEHLIAERDANIKRDQWLATSSPRLLVTARQLYRLANERVKPDHERKAGFQERDLPRIKAASDTIERSYDEKIDKALVLHSLSGYAAQPAALRRTGIDAALGIHDGMSEQELAALLDRLYAGSRLGDKAWRLEWLGKKAEDFKASNDSLIKVAVAMYEPGLQREAEDEELAGKLQQAYVSYMAAKLAYMNSRGLPVYPDANSTLRVTYGHITGREHGADGIGSWTPFTTVKGLAAKATGEGEFNAPQAQLAAIKSKDFGRYVDPALKTVPVNFLGTLDITGGNSGSPVLNAQGEFVGLAFDATLDSIISDWNYNVKNTRSIQVDARYMLWNMKHVDKADALLKELGVQDIALRP